MGKSSCSRFRRYLKPLILLWWSQAEGHSMVNALSDVCTFELENGAAVVLPRGALIAPGTLAYPCSRASTEFEQHPCTCNPDLEGQLECPFCLESQTFGGAICVNGGETVLVQGMNNNEELLQTCICRDGGMNCDLTDVGQTIMGTREDAQRVLQTNVFAVSQDNGADHCIINGFRFEKGQPLGFAYDSGCGGSAFDYQCLCNPDVSGSVECPFCYYDIDDDAGFLCLRDEEIATFEKNGYGETTCGCQVLDNGIKLLARSNCRFDTFDANSCVLELPEGGIRVIPAGAPIGDLKPSRCGPDYPCYCDPWVPGWIWCPYCTYVDNGSSLLCAENGDETTFYNLQNKTMDTCTCEIPMDPLDPPSSSCESRPVPQDRPTNPTRPDVAGDTRDTCLWRGDTYNRGESLGDTFVTRCGPTTEFPCFCNPDFDPPIECPYCSLFTPEKNMFCLRDGQIGSFVNFAEQSVTCGCDVSGAEPMGIENCDYGPNFANTCIFVGWDGSLKTYNAGEIVEGEVDSTCGADFPCYCDPSAINQLTCPYCRVVEESGGTVCAKDGERFTYNGDSGVRESCTCNVDVLRGPLISCSEQAFLDSQPTQRPTQQPMSVTRRSERTCSVKDQNGERVEIEDRSSFGSLIEGACKNPREYPAFCKANVQAVSRQNFQIEYPYCVFEDTQSGPIICARDGELVQYKNDAGVLVQCSCAIYTEPTQNCIPVLEASKATRIQQSALCLMIFLILL